jgi:ABC-type transporter Mla maintaining outer membrane lipid asymmetry ATPase subunit MlaF
MYEHLSLLRASFVECPEEATYLSLRMPLSLLILLPHMRKRDFKSGGMLRRLSNMAMVGEVKVLTLDEPTTDPDPVTKRLICDTRL